MKEISAKKYAKVRKTLVQETEDAWSKINCTLTPLETDFFTCRHCLNETLTRVSKVNLCMDCYIPMITTGHCSKCGKVLIKENCTDRCTNENRCRVDA